MKPAAFDYLRPATLAEATAALSGPTGMAVALGGGQSLMPLLALRVAPADLVVDLGRLSELRITSETADDVHLGAGITHAMIEDGKVPVLTSDPSAGLMRRVAANIAYRAVRNHGTIGGSLALADPAADWPAVFLALDAIINVVGPSGQRSIATDAFLHGAYSTALEPGDIIVSIGVPKLGKAARTGYVKVVRKSGAFANAIGCVVIPDTEKKPRAVLGGTTTRARLLPALATHLAAPSPDLSDAVLRAAVGTDLASVAPDADAYQQRLYTATILRAVREAYA